MQVPQGPTNRIQELDVSYRDHVPFVQIYPRDHLALDYTQNAP